MTSPSIVILTEPANCALADGQLLLQAVLEAQELSREGVPVSHAFCDNPAAAESFIEAYANAFAGLQLHSPDLPPPEQLYSMMVDGRLAPLPGSNPAPDGPMPESAVTIHPLVVLSLGPPDALMQALEGNRFARSNINVVEIAPVQRAGSASVPVAEAVAAHVIAGASWSPDISPSSEFREDEEGASADSPLHLDSAEFNLDDIRTDDDRDRAQLSQPAAAIVEAAAHVSAVAGATPSVHAGGWVIDSSNPASPASQTGPGLEPETRSTAAAASTSTNPTAHEPTAVAPAVPEPVVAPDPSPSQAETANAEGSTPSNPPLGADPVTPPSSSADDVGTPGPAETADAEGGTPLNPPLGADPATPPPSSADDVGTPGPAETADTEGDTPLNPPLGADPAAQPPSSAGDADSPGQPSPGSGAGDGLPDAEQVSDATDETAASPTPGTADADTTELEEDLADNGSSFSDPGEDVVYPPTGSFTSDNDMPYSLPLAAAPEAGDFGGILRMSMADDIVDLEAMFSGDDHAAVTAEPFDPILMGRGAPNGPDQHGDGRPQDAGPGPFDKPTPHHDTREDGDTMPVHDLDL